MAENLRRATRLAPNYVTAHQWLARVLLSEGYLPDAVTEMDVAADLDPLSPIIVDNLAVVYAGVGRYADALAAADRALQLRPDIVTSLMWRAYALIHLGRPAEALTTARQMQLLVQQSDGSKSGFDVSRGIVALTLARNGLQNEAIRFADESAALGVYSGFFAQVNSGNSVKALSLLTPQGLGRNTIGHLWLPEVDAVRAEPRFVRLLAELGLTEAHARAMAWRAANQRRDAGGRKADGP